MSKPEIRPEDLYASLYMGPEEIVRVSGKYHFLSTKRKRDLLLAMQDWVASELKKLEGGV